MINGITAIVKVKEFHNHPVNIKRNTPIRRLGFEQVHELDEHFDDDDVIEDAKSDFVENFQYIIDEEEEMHL